MLKFGGIRDNLFISHHDMKLLVTQHSLADWMRHTACECQFVTHLLGAADLSTVTNAPFPPENACCVTVSLGSSLSVHLRHPSPGISQYQHDTLREGWSNLWFTLMATAWPKGEVPQSQWPAVG